MSLHAIKKCRRCGRTLTLYTSKITTIKNKISRKKPLTKIQQQHLNIICSANMVEQNEHTKQGLFNFC